VEFDYLWLKEANLGQCSGCHACIRFGEEKCPLKDDRAAIEARMLAADGLILATPVYAMQVSYLMKTFIDHFSYLWHRPRFFGKFAMGLASGGGQFKETLGYLKLNAQSWGFTWVTGLGAPHADALVPKARQNYERSVEKTARRFYQAVERKRIPAPGLYDLIRFRVWRVNATACKEFIPADFKHWTEKGWFERDYYSGVKVGPVKRGASRLMEGVIRSFLRSVYVGY
jgi:multimeric flavodoxin WrbA